MSGAAIRSLVERHAKGLEDIAVAMAKDGIGLHSTRGHVPVLRRMAEAMRGDAARGKTPHEFNAVDYPMSYASADAASALPYSVVHALESAGVNLGPDETISLDSLNASMAAAETAPGDRILCKTELARIGRLTSQ
jgi:hypothetical protein